MASKSGTKIYKCETCGLATTEKGHLCTPKEVKKAYTCEYCGLTVSDPRHVCKPRVAKLNYVCVAVGKEELCQPKKIKG
jgi:DNA-directed RNA polymerase subunit RPC12/RpoP